MLIGANDVRDGVPLQEYRDNPGVIVARVQDGTTTRIALLSLPPLGEDLDGEPNVERARQRPAPAGRPPAPH